MKSFASADGYGIVDYFEGASLIRWLLANRDLGVRTPQEAFNLAGRLVFRNIITLANSSLTPSSARRMSGTAGPPFDEGGRYTIVSDRQQTHRFSQSSDDSDLGELLSLSVSTPSSMVATNIAALRNSTTKPSTLVEVKASTPRGNQILSDLDALLNPARRMSVTDALNGGRGAYIESALSEMGRRMSFDWTNHQAPSSSPRSTGSGSEGPVLSSSPGVRPIVASKGGLRHSRSAGRTVPSQSSEGEPRAVHRAGSVPHSHTSPPAINVADADAPDEAPYVPRRQVVVVNAPRHPSQSSNSSYGSAISGFTTTTGTTNTTGSTKSSESVDEGSHQTSSSMQTDE